MKNGAVVVVQPYIQATESPEFAQVTEIFVLLTKKVFLGVKKFEVIDFYSHYHAWAVTHTDTKTVVGFEELCSHQLLHARPSNINFGIVKLISLKYSVFEAI